MCDCGCGGCSPKKPVLINENLAPKEILSEGLKYHMDNALPLTEHVYRAGSQKYFELWAEARALYTRGILEVQGDDLQVLTETDLGHFGMFEGKKVPLDFPMLDEEVNSRDLNNAVYRLKNVYKYLDIEYKETRRGEKYVQINYIPVTSPQSQNPEFVNVRYNNDEDLEIIKNRLDFPIELTEGEVQEEANLILTKILQQLQDSDIEGRKNSKDLVKALYQLDTSMDFIASALTGRDTLDISVDQDTYGKLANAKESLLKEIIVRIVEEKKKKLNKPMRDSSGGKAYKVYVKDPKTKKIKTVRFGSGGLRAKINDKKARNAFAKRHNCAQKKDKTKAGYWSCRLPRYAKLLGLKSNFGGFW
jgi:hypothetical protein